jgi:hypothetical protein
MEESRCGLKELSCHLQKVTEEKHKNLNQDTILAEFWIRHLSNTSQKHYHLNELAQSVDFRSRSVIVPLLPYII